MSAPETEEAKASAAERLKRKVATYDSQNDAARAAGVSPSQLSYFIRGERKPEYPTAKKLEAAFGIPAGDWFEAAPAPVPSKRRRTKAA